MESRTVMHGGERTNPSGKPVSNRILLSLPDDEYRQIRAHLEFVKLEPHRVLHEPGEKLRFAYFLNSGLASLLAMMREGKAVEAGVVGFEGIVGTALAVSLLRSPLRAVMQIGGDGFRINGPALQASFRTLPELSMRLSRYAVLQGMQAAQTAACNRLHEIRRRFARLCCLGQAFTGRWRNGRIAPAVARSKALDIQSAVAIVPPVGQTDDPFETHHPPVVQLVGGKKLRIVVEVMQKPAELPERPVMAIKPGADITARKGGRIENQERRRQTRVRGVAGGPEVDHAGPVQAFDQRVSIRCLTEALDFGAHEGLLS